MREAIWLITGGPMQHIAAKKIQASGYALIVSDRSSQAVCAGFADLFLPIDTFDVAAHLENCAKVKKQFNIKAVMTFAADCHYTVACVAESLGLHGLNPSISQVCRDKTLTRKILRDAGIYQPTSFCVASYEEAIDILKKYAELSFVLKATDNSGSRGFHVIDEAQKLSVEQFKLTQAYGSTGNVILEERLVADPSQISEASVETLWFNGKMYGLNSVDRIFPGDLKFFPDIKMPFPLQQGIEVGHVNPSIRDFALKQETMKLIEQAGLALGMGHEKGGYVLKADIYYSTKGPVIVELTPRSSGGWDSSGTSPARGADIAGGVMHLALGQPVTLDDWYRYFHYHDAERTAVVLSRIPENAVDCIGRQFTLASGYADTQTLINLALKQLENEDYVSIQ